MPARYRSPFVASIACLGALNAAACASDTTSDAGDAADAGTTDDGDFDADYPATGIGIVEVEANQGIQVDIYRDSEWVAGSERNARLAQNRITVFRAYWTLTEDWQPREISGVLTLSYPDGTSKQFERTTMVEGETSPVGYADNFTFVVPEDSTPSGTKFQIALFETEGGHSDDTPHPTVGNISPEEPLLVGFENSYQKLRVALQPIHHAIPGKACPDYPPLPEEDVDLFRRELHQQNPTDTVEIVPMPVQTWTDDMSSFGPVLNWMATNRENWGVTPDMYIYGIVRLCDPGPSQGAGSIIAGQAIDIPGPPTPSNGWSRTSVGRYYIAGVDMTAPNKQTLETFVHEVGHTQGRRHVDCGGAAGVDGAYPYPGGIIAKWGIGIETGQLVSPQGGKDYMTYCGTAWVSDYGWGRIWPYIQEISSWELEGMPPFDPSARMLVGLVDADGRSSWSVVHGAPDGRPLAPADHVEWTQGGKVHALPAFRGDMGEGGYNLTIPLPADSGDLALDDESAAWTWVHGDARIAIRP